MAEVFAGFVSGYVLALLSTPPLAFALLRLRATSELLARLLPAGTSAIAFALLIHGGLMLFLTAIGIVLGLLLLAMASGDAAAGSLNGPFSLFVAAAALALLAPFAIVSRRLRPYVVAAYALFVAVFGWLMPYLAEWSSFDS